MRISEECFLCIHLRRSEDSVALLFARNVEVTAEVTVPTVHDAVESSPLVVGSLSESGEARGQGSSSLSAINLCINASHRYRSNSSASKLQLATVQPCRGRNLMPRPSYPGHNYGFGLFIKVTLEMVTAKRFCSCKECSLAPYGEKRPVTKEECVGHVQKRVGSNLTTEHWRKIWKERSCPVPGQGFSGGGRFTDSSDRPSAYLLCHGNSRKRRNLFHLKPESCSCTSTMSKTGDVLPIGSTTFLRLQQSSDDQSRHEFFVTGWRSELSYPSPWPSESGLTI